MLSGPVLQAILVPIGFPGLIRSNLFHLNMYTSPAILSILIYFILTILIMYKFNEYLVLDNSVVEKNSINSDSNLLINFNFNKIFFFQKSNSIIYFSSSLFFQDDLSESIKNLPPPDYVAIALSLLLFFINCFVFSFYET